MEKTLPKTLDDFHTKEYWNEFYKQSDIIKQKGFEWYANYDDVKDQLDSNFKTINTGITKAEAHVLVPGCGDSKLSHQMRLDGYGKVTSIDFEEEIIEKMKIEVGVPGVEDYITMDVKDMKGIEDASIDVSLDKGTLDALYTGIDEENEAAIAKYFTELMRVTKPNNGQIVFISLLQSHILEKLISFFLKNEDHANRYHWKSITELKFEEIFVQGNPTDSKAEESVHRVAYLITVKRSEFDPKNQKMRAFKENFETMINLNGNLAPIDKAKSEIMVTQMVNLQHGHIKKLSKGRILEIHLESATETTDAEKSRFKLCIVDSEDEDILQKNTCAILIVPQGKETYPVYSTESGYKRLNASVAHSRLIVVHLNSGQSFDSFEAVKKELEGSIIRFAQQGYTNEIPYISEGADIGKRMMIGKKYHIIREEDKFDDEEIDTYEHVDEYVIEDLRAGEDEEDRHILRAVKFKTKLGEVQSDIIIKRKRNRGKKEHLSSFTKVRSPLWKTDEDEFLYIDHNHLNSEYLAAMMAGLCTYAPSFEDENNTEKKSNFLVLGTGAGILPMFIYKTMSPMIGRLNTVDIDETIVKIGEDYFGFNTDLGSNFRSHITSAEEYLANETLPGKTNVLFVDIGSGDTEFKYIPPKSILTEDFFKGIHRALNEDQHVVLFNTCAFSKADKHEIHKFMTSQFKHVSYMNCSESSNRVYAMSNSHAPDLTKTHEKTVKYFVKTFCDSKNADGHDWASKMDMSNLLSEMKVDQGNKVEVKIEHAEKTEPAKKKKPRKK
ncbi:unnamed protein product [Moneuplotes crassus]|uniref:Methyltransferase domain-containing protein n=1 Tax=Euplotes crassus TaxID=5936 RepID=A0AAD1Y9X0_EUPCR|nr:unnamed protein product [Moneuplotes crassus]